MNFRSLFATAALLACTPAAFADCTDTRQGPYFGTFGIENTMNIGCWMVRYDANTQIVNSQNQAIPVTDFQFNDEVIATGCQLPDFSLMAERIERVTGGPIATCNDPFGGPFFGLDTANSQFFMSCWRVTYDGTTTIVNAQDQPISLTQIPDFDEVQILGCQQPDFSLRATKVTWMNSGTGMASNFDVQVSLGNNGNASYFVSNCTAAGVCTVGAPNPSLNLEIGKRYLFSFPSPGTHPFSLVSTNNNNRADNPLLIHGAGFGSMEGDAGVNWVESGADFYFTVTPALAAAMNGIGATPGYRCETQPTTMRGLVNLQAPSSVGDWAMYQ